MYLFLVLVLIFGFVVFFGAPYLPTLKKQRYQVLKLLNLEAGQTILELGCGDGRLLKLAAEQGVNSIGIELNPILVLVAKVVNIKHRDLVTIKWANFWSIDWPKCDAIYIFLIDRFMQKFDDCATSQKISNTLVLSYGYKIPKKKYLKKHMGFYLYKY